MDVNYFLKELSVILEVSIKDVSMKDKLSKFDKWDSLAMMSFVIFFRDKAKNEIDPMKVSKCQSISNLFDLIN